MILLQALQYLPIFVTIIGTATIIATNIGTATTISITSSNDKSIAISIDTATSVAILTNIIVTTSDFDAYYYISRSSTKRVD